jgi:DNA-binding NarL/FixJ family response regulator
MKTGLSFSGLEKPKPILIVEDHPVVRFGLATLLNKHVGYMVCGEAVDQQEALAKIRELNPDLVTVDLNLKSSHGLELIKDIHVQFPALRVLVVSMYDEYLNARRILSAGAHGYMTKQEPLPLVLTAIERIFAGEIYVSHQVTSQMALQLAKRKGDRHVPDVRNLTDRELEVFELTGDGLSIRQIAAQLKLGLSTIETYRTRIKEKLCLDEHSELLKSAIHWNRSGSLERRPEAVNPDALKGRDLGPINIKILMPSKPETLGP